MQTIWGRCQGWYARTSQAAYVLLFPVFLHDKQFSGHLPESMLCTSHAANLKSCTMASHCILTSLDFSQRLQRAFVSQFLGPLPTSILNPEDGQTISNLSWRSTKLSWSSRTEGTYQRDYQKEWAAGVGFIRVRALVWGFHGTLIFLRFSRRAITICKRLPAIQPSHQWKASSIRIVVKFASNRERLVLLFLAFSRDKGCVRDLCTDYQSFSSVQCTVHAV